MWIRFNTPKKAEQKQYIGGRGTISPIALALLVDKFGT